MAIESLEKQIRLATKYDFIYNPLDYNSIKGTLLSLGYDLPNPPPNIPNIGQKLDLMPNGDLGRKEDIILDVLSEKQVIGIRSNDEMKVLEEFNKLEEQLERDIGMGLSSIAKF